MRGRRVHRLWGLAGCLLLAVGLAGCERPLEGAESLPAFAEASDALEAYAAEEASLTALLSELPTGTTEPADAGAALPVLATARESLEAQATHLDEARVALTGIGALDVPGRYRTYAGLQLEAVEALVAVREAAAAYVSALEALYGALSAENPGQEQVDAASELAGIERGLLASAETSYAAAAERVTAFREGRDE